MANRFHAGWGLALGMAMFGLSVQGQFPPLADSLDPPTPVVVVRVRVPAEATPGADLTYRITAENTSTAAAHHVRVKVTLPRNAKLVRSDPPAEDDAGATTWKIGTLSGRTRRDMTLVLKPSGDDDVNLCARVQYEHGACVKTRMVRPGLQFRRSGPARGSLYATLAYRLEVSNTGRGVAKDVVVEETLPVGMLYLDSKPGAKGDNPLSWKLGDLPYGATRVIEYQAAANAAGSHTIKGEARAAGGIKSESSHSVSVGKAGLEVAMKGPAAGVVGATVRYTITVANPGTESLKNVTLADELPAEVQFVGATNGGKPDGTVVRWNLGTIPAGAKREATLDVASRHPGTFNNVCTVRADGGLREQGKATTVFAVPGG